MKIRFLVKEYPYQKNSNLILVSRGKWLQIVHASKALPAAEKRYFIVDDIIDDNGLDRTYIEVDYATYLEWHREESKKYYQEKTAPNYTVVSLDAEIPNSTVVSLHEAVGTDYCLEDEVISSLRVEALRRELEKWQPWAGDLLDLYIEGNKYDLGAFAKSHNMSRSTFYRYVRQFEKKVVFLLKL